MPAFKVLEVGPSSEDQFQAEESEPVQQGGSQDRVAEVVSRVRAVSVDKLLLRGHEQLHVPGGVIGVECKLA